MAHLGRHIDRFIEVSMGNHMPPRFVSRAVSRSFIVALCRAAASYSFSSYLSHPISGHEPSQPSIGLRPSY